MPWNRLKLVLDPRGFFAAPVNTINRRENDRLLFSLFFFCLINVAILSTGKHIFILF